jgi:hypothetical protein
VKLRVYTDTSVLGGCEDEEFREHSIRLMESFVRGERVLVLSSLTVQELAAAPAAVRTRLSSVPESHIEMLPLGVEALDLAEAYLAAAVQARRESGTDSRIQLGEPAPGLSHDRDPNAAGGGVR